jgi:hypothetical protein
MYILSYLKSYRLFFFISTIFLGCFLFVSCNTAEEDSSPVLNRLILFKYKAEVTQAQIDEVKQTFFSLKEKVPGMLNVVWTKDINSDREKQFTYAITLSFSSEDALKSYQEHPDHQALVNNGPAIENFFAMNYWTE